MVIRKMEPSGHQSRVIGHHLAKVEEILTRDYERRWTYRLMNGLTETQDMLILGFTFHDVTIVNQLYCGCCDMLFMFIDEKHHQLVTYPVCEVPKTDLCMI